jgi:ABC-type spermidine/putrescine transport system permease subunit II
LEVLGLATVAAAFLLARYAVRLRRLINFLYCLPMIEVSKRIF